MKLGFKGIVITTLISSTICSMPLARAAHATNFLDALHQEVTNRVANPGTNTPPQKAALRAASNILGRNTRTFSADLFALATAATVLNKRFSNDTTLASLEDAAIVSYSAEAHAQLDKAEMHAGTNSLSRVLSNQLAKAEMALTSADNNSNGVPARARALAQAFNKIRIPLAKILQKYPTVPFEAPTDMATGRNLTLWENAVVNEQNIFYFHTTAGGTGDRFLHYSTHNPEELGTWTYQRLTPTTAVVHCSVTFTQAGARPAPYSHDIALTFTSATTGTFTAVNCLNENVQGTFVLSD